MGRNLFIFKILIIYNESSAVIAHMDHILYILFDGNFIIHSALVVLGLVMYRNLLELIYKFINFLKLLI